MPMAKKELDILNGSIWDKLLMIAIPIALGSILQQLFNSVDVAVVGRFCGTEALAAVGSNGSVINLIITLFVGLSVGSNAVISKLLGKKDDKGVSDAVHTSILVAVLSGLGLSLFGITFARPILELMSAPKEVIDLAAKYMKIYFVGMPVIMLYNFASAILRSKGDTKRPLVIMAVAGVVNAVLNVILVCYFHMDVDGVAIATVVANIISSFTLVWLLTKEKGALKLDLRKLRINKNTLAEMAKVGIPAGIQGMLFSISNVLIQSSMNTLGAQTVAASAAALNFEFISYFIINAFSMAAVTFIAQNYGAGKLRRCREVVRLTLTMAGVITVITSALLVGFGRKLLLVFTTDANVIEIAMIRMKFIISFEIINVFMDGLSGCLRGFGYSAVPAAICVFGVCVVRLIWIFTVFVKYPTFTTLMAIFPISWGITATFIIISYFVVIKRIRKQLVEGR